MKKNRAPKTTSPKKETKPAKKPGRKSKKGSAKPSGCAHSDCAQAVVTDGFCRLHYLAHWRERRAEENLRAERRLNAYVDRLAKRYPDDYLDKIREGIENEDIFKKTMEQLDLDPDADPDHETEREYLEKWVRNIKPEE